LSHFAAYFSAACLYSACACIYIMVCTQARRQARLRARAESRSNPQAAAAAELCRCVLVCRCVLSTPKMVCDGMCGACRQHQRERDVWCVLSTLMMECVVHAVITNDGICCAFCQHQRRWCVWCLRAVHCEQMGMQVIALPHMYCNLQLVKHLVSN
jgi:hypothetical protein